MALILSIAELNLLSSEEDSQTTSSGTKTGYLNVSRSGPTQLESTLLQLMVDNLDIPGTAVGVDDNFFSLGGDSLIAMRLCAAARAVAVPLTVAMILQHPTVETMAKAVSLSRVPDQPPSAQSQETKPFDLLGNMAVAEEVRELVAGQCQVDSAAVQDAYPCTPLQQGLFLQSLMTPGSYMIQHCWNVPSSVDLACFKHAWEVVFGAFAMLRTRIVEGSDDNLWQAVLHEDLRWHDNTTSNVDGDGPAMGLGLPLYRFTLETRRDENCGHRLIIEAHHAALDGWSVNLLEDAFAKAYHGSEIGPRRQFCHFVGHVQSGDVKHHESYWKDQLASFEGGSWPASSSSNDEKARNIARLRVPINNSRKSAFTVSEYLRAAWAIVIASYVKSNDIVLGVVEDGRDSPIFGIEDIVGPTIATVPVRIHLKSNQRVLDLMRSIRNQRVVMMLHRHFGLQNITKLLPGAKVACDLQTRIDVRPSKSARTKDESIPLEYVGVEVQVQDCPLVLDCNLEESHIEFILDHSLTVLSRTQGREIVGRLASAFRRMKQDSSATTIGDLQAEGEMDNLQIDKEPLTLLK